MYSEDVDLCFKVRQAGCSNWLAPDVAIVHHGGGSTAARKISTFSSVLMLESRWRYFKLNRSVVYAIFFRIAIFLSSVARLMIAFSARLTAPRVSTRYEIWTGTLKTWAARFRWTVGGEGWARRI